MNQPNATTPAVRAVKLGLRFHFWRLQRALYSFAICRLYGHDWSCFGDEDEDGWFWDTGGGADSMTRSCIHCDHIECRTPLCGERQASKDRWIAHQRQRGEV